MLFGSEEIVIEDITVKINAEINSYMNTYLEDSWTIQNDLQLSEIFIARWKIDFTL